MMISKILVVEDDHDIHSLLISYLQKENYAFNSAYDGEQALTLLQENTYQLIILDLMLPKVNGFTVLEKIRQKGNTPVLIVSAKNEELDKIRGLGLGADDYITKPFTIGELLARVKAQLRRYLYLNNFSKEINDLLTYRELELNPTTYELKKDGRIIPLTAKEFELVKLFIANPTRVFTKAQIYKIVWKDDYMADENTVMVHIRRLRKKIETDPSKPDYIQTVWGIGYKLKEDEKWKR